MRAEAFAFVDEMDARSLPSCVCLYDSNWHQGVVGLIASRVRERCDRPVIAFASEEEGMLKGSARSINGVHIRDLLEAVSTAKPGLIGKFGGHAMAAGLSLAERHFDEFSKSAAEQLDRLYPEADFSGTILTDGDLPAAAMNLKFAKLLRDAGPWGAGFPEPLFTGNFEIAEQRTVGENHLKLRVTPVVFENLVFDLDLARSVLYREGDAVPVDGPGFTAILVMARRLLGLFPPPVSHLDLILGFRRERELLVRE